SYSQYLRLRELALSGINLEETFLIDEIPNLSFYQASSPLRRTSLQIDQTEGFASNVRTSLKGYVQYRLTNELEERGDMRHRFRSKLTIGEYWQFSGAVERDFTGRRRLSNRSVSYLSKNGVLRRATVGTFNKRFGLGTLYGYRGKLFSGSGIIDNEAILIPDYGGFNGLLIEAVKGHWSYQALSSISRDDTHSLFTTGIHLLLNSGNLKPAITFGYDRLGNRNSGQEISLAKSAIGMNYRYNSGFSSVEMAGQTGNSSGWAAVAEGRHRFRGADLTYAGWVYSDSFRGFTSGSKAVDLSKSQLIDEVDFEYRDKRAGQKGMQLRTITTLSGRTEFVTALRVAGFYRGYSSVQLLSGLEEEISPGLTIRADLLLRNKVRPPSAGSTSRLRRVRLETRIQSSNWQVRTYIGHTVSTETEDYFSAFIRLKLSLPADQQLEIWSNMGRLRKDRIDYWYGYIRQSSMLRKNLSIAFKLSHRYSRSSDSGGDTQLTLELQATL
ncbi:MAG: hypothetical protein V3T31_09755, partial [candidate division Zixibacteria bacterium]